MLQKTMFDEQTLFILHIIDEGLLRRTIPDFNLNRLLDSSAMEVRSYLEMNGLEDENQVFRTEDGYAKIVATNIEKPDEEITIWSYNFDGEMKVECAIQQLRNQINSIDREKVHRLFLQLEDYLQKADNGEMSHSEVLHRIGIREFLPEHTILATTWHIDDIRDRFPAGTTDHELFNVLLGIEDQLSDAAVREGWEVISILIGAEQDESNE